MNYVKMLGLLAIAAAALMTFAGTAPATTVTSSTGSTPTIHALSVGHVTTHNAIATLSCNSTITFTIEHHGTGVTAAGKVATWSFTNCTNGTVHTDAQGMIATPGSLEIHATSNTGNATVTSTGAKITKTMFGVECGYTTNSTDLGEIIGGEHAVFKVNGSIPRTHGSVFCGSSGNLTGEYKFTHPTDLTIH